LDQQGLEAQRALAKCAAKPVVGHPHA
jgi:hypothetical protein